MIEQGYLTRLIEMLTAGPALVNSNSKTSLLHSSEKHAAIPVGWLKTLGRIIDFDFSGIISTVVTSPGTLTLGFAAGATDIFSSGAMAMNIVAKTDVHWRFRGSLVLKETGGGTASKFFPIGCEFVSNAVIGAAAVTAGGAGTHLLPYNATPALGTGIDNAQSYLFDLNAQWQTANAANSIQLLGGRIKIFN